MKTDSTINSLDKTPDILKNDLDRNLCVCNEVVKSDIIKAITMGRQQWKRCKNRLMPQMELAVALGR